ncbi:hypothetical protein [Halocatena halophila]|uniref:hypothetical protein n=1 Tax=Halocatena halophila TaxID=2814576 RepID=UPI002ED5426C
MWVFDEDLTDVRIDKLIVDPSTTILASLVRGGGQATRLTRATHKEIKTLPAYESPEQQYTSLKVPEAAVSGQTIDITVTGTNSGTVIGGETVNVYIDGRQVGTT